MSERELIGAAAPPMANGEVLFDAPWQGRVFAMANALCDAQVFEWRDFQACLIDEIGQEEVGPDAAGYYERFQRALERVVYDRDVVSRDMVSDRATQISNRPHGHDH